MAAPLSAPRSDVEELTGEKPKEAASREPFAFLLSTAQLLFTNGQTTERILEAVARLAEAFNMHATVIAHWGDLTVHIEQPGEPMRETVLARPAGVEMARVSAAIQLADRICKGETGVSQARSALDEIAHLPPVSLARFVLLTGAAAAAMGVIFGELSPVNLGLIAVSAGLGAALRRQLARFSTSPFLQPFCAAMLAGVFGAATIRFPGHPASQLVALCPCIMLMPGPHFLNGTLDLAHLRLPLGMARVIFATLITLMICTGLVAGLSLAGFTLPASAPSHAAPLLYDAIAAGIAVAGFGTAFSMPWRMLPAPIAIGMLAHASRWGALAEGGASTAKGAFVACLVVGLIVTPIANKLRLPFAAFAFVCVVPLIPGIPLFRMAGGLAALGGAHSQRILFGALTDGVTAFLTLLAMTFGLMLPKLGIEHLRPSPHTSAGKNRS